ncbi:hypothetical protein Tco_0561731 [Tanacetum coccineum]
MDIADHPKVICVEVGGHDIHRINHLAFGTDSPTSISGKVHIPSYGVDELSGSKVTFAIQQDPSRSKSNGPASGTPPSPLAESIRVAINLEYLEQSVMIGVNLSNEGKRAICEVLKANLDVFASKPADMTGVPRTLAEHKLGIKEITPPVRQKREEKLKKEGNS